MTTIAALLRAPFLLRQPTTMLLALLVLVSLSVVVVGINAEREPAQRALLVWLIVGLGQLMVLSEVFRNSTALHALHLNRRLPSPTRLVRVALIVWALIATLPPLVLSIRVGGEPLWMLLIALALIGWASVVHWLVAGLLLSAFGLVVIELIYRRFSLSVIDLLMSISPILLALLLVLPGLALLIRALPRVFAPKCEREVAAGWAQESPMWPKESDPQDRGESVAIPPSAATVDPLAEILGARSRPTLNVRQQLVLALVGALLALLSQRFLNWPDAAFPAVIGMVAALLGLTVVSEVLDAFSRAPEECRALGLLPATPRDRALLERLIGHYVQRVRLAPTLALPLMLGGLLVSGQAPLQMLIEGVLISAAMIAAMAFAGLWLALALCFRFKSRAALSALLGWFTAVIVLRFALEIDGLGWLAIGAGLIVALPLIGAWRLRAPRLRVHWLT
jgi:hypothetical protein